MSENYRISDDWRDLEVFGITHDAIEEEICENYKQMVTDMHRDHKRSPHKLMFEEPAKRANATRDVLRDPGDNQREM